MKNTKKKLISSLVTLMVSFCMLPGSTYAWFTDTATNTGNKIQAGILDVTLLKDDGSGNYEDISDSDEPVYDYDKWEPGYSIPAAFKVGNNGNLALKYRLTFNVTESKTGLENADDSTLEHLTKINANGRLEDVLEVYRASSKEECTSANLIGTLSEVINGGAVYEGSLLAGETSDALDIVVLMPTSADNKYENASILFDIRLVATQMSAEEDGWGSIYYDALANGGEPEIFERETATKEYETDGITLTTEHATVDVPAGAELENGDPLTQGDTLTLYVEPGEADAGLIIDSGNETTTYEVTLENQEGIKLASSDEGYRVQLYIGVVDLQALYHKTQQMTKVNSASEVDEAGEYYYDISNGMLTFITDSFSPFTSEYLFAGGIGTEEYPYLLADTDMLVKINDLSWLNYAYSAYNGDNWDEACAYADAQNTKTAYYKMAKKNMTIDAADLPFLYLDGCFDGNGATFNNVSRALFYGLRNENGAIVVKNLTINAHIARNSYFEAAVALYPEGDIVMENVDVHGYIEGTAAAPYIALGPNTQIDYVFRDCYSDATVVATGESASGFIVHPYCAAGSTITLENSRYTGAMSAKGKTYYFRVNASGSLTIYTDEQNGEELYTNPADTYTGNADLYTKGGVIYKAGTKLATSAITEPEGIDLLSVEKAENAEYAVATLNIGPNGTDEKGNYMGVYINEDCDDNGESFITKTVKNYNITINGDATQTTGISADGTTYNVVRSTYGHTYGAAFARIIQYDAEDRIVKISTLNLK